MTGVISNVNERGYFFVTGDDQISYFCHKTSLTDELLFDELRKGDTVELLAVEQAPRGWKATSVIPRLDAQPPQEAQVAAQ